MKIKIAFDLDGIFIDKPPFISKDLLESLFRGTKCQKNNPCYRFPQSKIEQYIRKISHYYLLRPPIKKNIKFLKKINQTKKYQIYLISSRYSFLEKETYSWLKKRNIDKCFYKIILNKKNQQPHAFKKKEIKKIKPSFYFEDDPLIVKYLGKKVKDTKVIFVAQKKLHLPLTA